MRAMILSVGLVAAWAWGCDDTAETATPDAAAAPDAAIGSDAEEMDTAPPDAEPADTSMPDAGPASTLEFAVDGPGPYAVGYRSWPVTYTVPGTGEARTIDVHAWYPAEAVEGEHPRFLNLFDDNVSVIDAPARGPAGEAYPVHVYSHGDRGFGGTSAFLMQRFASHGWVAIAPDHVGNLLTANERGDLVAHFIERPADITATLDALAALPADDPLSRADVSRVLLSGHSRGVYTVWAGGGAAYDLAAIEAARPDATDGERSAFAAGLGDPRVAAVVGLAGGYRESWFGPDGFRAVQIPFQAQSGTADNPDSMRAVFDRVMGLDYTWIEIEGACHQTFALGGCETIDRDLGFEIVDTYALAFARRHVLGDDDPRTVGIVEGTVEVAAEATVRRR